VGARAREGVLLFFLDGVVLLFVLCVELCCVVACDGSRCSVLLLLPPFRFLLCVVSRLCCLCCGELCAVLLCAMLCCCAVVAVCVVLYVCSACCVVCVLCCVVLCCTVLCCCCVLRCSAEGVFAPIYKISPLKLFQKKTNK